MLEYGLPFARVGDSHIKVIGVLQPVRFFEINPKKNKVIPRSHFVGMAPRKILLPLRGTEIKQCSHTFDLAFIPLLVKIISFPSMSSQESLNELAPKSSSLANMFGSPCSLFVF